MTLIREGTWRGVQPFENQEVDPEMSEQELATICLSLEKNNYSILQKATGARDAWDRSHVRGRSKITVFFEGHGSIEYYVDELVTTANNLCEIGFEVNDQWLGSLPLKGLPSYYSLMIMGLQHLGLNLQVLQDVKWPIDGAQIEEALFTKQKQRRPNSGVGFKREKRCFSCGGLGHFAADCPQQVKQSNKTKSKKALVAMLAVRKASCHMARSTANFKRLETYEQSVDTANNQSMMSDAKGLVNLELAEGPIEFRDVVLVPDLATNLLSIGCKVEDDDNGAIIASGTEVDGLYKLNRKHGDEMSFLTTEASIWHRRLGHLNQKSMRKLESMTKWSFRTDDPNTRREGQENDERCRVGQTFLSGGRVNHGILGQPKSCQSTGIDDS
ncbi:uncharacterized protein LOC129759663 [Uranotaenia lowii]|uniref:uncharacterized protein LOC129759663 n=1 Tax=Uranotaenia lowii TaxID=190385 RepID=UPI00247A215A|nr:uncharacterized protein LOC129759663 [Uranotaenia lowii]